MIETMGKKEIVEKESSKVIANCDRLSHLKFSPTQPYAYTEQGVAMLSAVLHSKDAEDISVIIMDGFVAMRRFLASNAQVFQRLEQIEYKLLENNHKFEQIFSKLEEKSLEPKQGIFYDGQIYDSYAFINSIIKSATKRIVLIDNKVYHIGASLKDLGKKWFAFSLMENMLPGDLISRLTPTAGNPAGR